MIPPRFLLVLITALAALALSRQAAAQDAGCPRFDRPELRVDTQLVPLKRDFAKTLPQLQAMPGRSAGPQGAESGQVLGLAHAIIDAKLKVRLRVLIPVVENAIAGASFRPGDVLPSRKGITVEIGNTDAEGRLILADALALACEESPEILIDMATLTGAARVALGPELPPLYCTDDAFADEVLAAGLAWDGPLWRMPLWANYDAMLSSRIADVNHISPGGFAGSITAALFLKRFAEGAGTWMHLDIFAWAPEARPGRPFGGTDQGIRAIYQALKRRFR